MQLLKEVQFFSDGFPLVRYFLSCRLKYLYSCFLPIFFLNAITVIFLFVQEFFLLLLLLLAAVITISLRLFKYSSSL